MWKTVPGAQRKTEVNLAKRDELIGRMRQTTDNGWAGWLEQMMETLRVSHGPSCFSPLRGEAVTGGPLCLSGAQTTVWEECGPSKQKQLK